MPTSDLYIGQPKAKPGASPDHDKAWAVLSTLGIFLVLVGLVDIALALLAPEPGDPAWRFSVAALLIGGLPLPSLGVVAGLVAALARGARAASRAWGVVCLLFALLILLALIALFLALPEVQAVTPVEGAADLSRTVTRTALVGGVFLLLHLYAGARGLFHRPNTAVAG